MGLVTVVLDFFLNSISMGCRYDSALKGEALNQTVRSSKSSNRFPVLSPYFAERLGPHCTAAAHWEGTQSRVVIRHLQPLQFSDSDSPLCCEATSPITSPQLLSSDHSSIDVPDSPGWRVAPHWRPLEGLTGKGFSFMGPAQGSSCVTVSSGHTSLLDKVSYPSKLHRGEPLHYPDKERTAIEAEI